MGLFCRIIIFRFRLRKYKYKATAKINCDVMQTGGDCVRGSLQGGGGGGCRFPDHRRPVPPPATASSIAPPPPLPPHHGTGGRTGGVSVGTRGKHMPKHNHCPDAAQVTSTCDVRSAGATAIDMPTEKN